MRLWSWFRARRWWTKILLGAPAALLAAAIVYVAARSCQFLAAEKEAGLFIPSTANVVVRAKELESHLKRIEESVAWRVLRRRVLKDPAIRPAINRALKDGGLPTLDELEDERNRDLYSVDLLLRAAGRDAAAGLRIDDGRGPLRAVAITRLRWSDYLLTPFAPLVLKSEEVAGRSVLRLPMGRTTLLIAQEGRLVLAATDKDLLAQALRRTGTESSGDHPLSARVEFGRSAALQDVRRAAGSCGAFPQVRMESVRAAEAWMDFSGTAALVELLLEGAEPAREEAVPPWAFARLAPPNTTGMCVSSSGVPELFEGLRSIKPQGSNDTVAKNVKEALAALDEVGFSSEFLPKLGNGMALFTGVVEREKQSFPAFVLVIPSKDERGAVETLCKVIRERAKGVADSQFGSTVVGDTVMWSFEPPRGFRVGDFLRPCFAAIPGAFVFGNNMTFTEAVLRGAGAGEEEAAPLVPAKRLRELGIVAEPGWAGGMFLLPAIRESLDGPIPRVASYLVEMEMGPAAAFRAKLEAELRQQGRKLTDDEMVKLFGVRVRAMERDKEEELRGSLHALDFVKWLSFSLDPTPKGASLRAALEFR